MKNHGIRHVALSVESQNYELRLTLGALAEIESVLGCNDLKSLVEELKSLNSDKLRCMLIALLRAADAIEPATIADRADPVQAAAAITEVVKTGFAA